MQIGLVAVDGHNNFPNLALMRLSTWHKRQDDTVEWWNGFEHFDRVYMSKVFTFTPDFDTAITADEIVTGGTGYKDYDGGEPTEEQKRFARWVNQKALFRSCTWEDFQNQRKRTGPVSVRWRQTQAPFSFCTEGMET